MVLRPIRPGGQEEDGGVIAVATALVVAFVVIPLLAIVVDLGLTRVADSQAVSAADGAALAAAVDYSTKADMASAASAAQRVAQVNFGLSPGAWATCVDQNPLPTPGPTGPGNCVSFDLVARRVRVHIPERQIPTVFAGLLGSRPLAATATSTATWGTFRSACTLCVLGAYQGGAQTVVVSGGDVAVGGTLSVPSGGALLADTGRTVTYTAAPVTILGTVRPTPSLGPVPVDPLSASLAALAARPEATGSAVSAPAPRGTPQCTPGTYQDVSGCTHFDPGVYVITGSPYIRQTVTLGANTAGAVFYLTCSTPFWVYPVRPARCTSTISLPPRVSGAASGSVTLTGDPSSFGGLVLAFDPTMTANQRFAGNGTLKVVGSIDGPGITLRDPSTTPSAQLIISGGRLVVGAVQYGTVNPGHPYVTVQAPGAQPVAPGPIRLIPES